MFLIVYLCPLYLKVSFAEYKMFGSLDLSVILFSFGKKCLCQKDGW